MLGESDGEKLALGETEALILGDKEGENEGLILDDSEGLAEEL